MTGLVTYLELFTYTLVLIGIVALYNRKDK